MVQSGIEDHGGNTEKDDHRMTIGQTILPSKFEVKSGAIPKQTPRIGA
jgi:hypothetical protein